MPVEIVFCFPTLYFQLVFLKRKVCVSVSPVWVLRISSRVRENER